MYVCNRREDRKKENGNARKKRLEMHLPYFFGIYFSLFYVAIWYILRFNCLIILSCISCCYIFVFLFVLFHYHMRIFYYILSYFLN